MSNVQRVEVLIVGGGMAGGCLAAALADSGLSIVVLDGAPVPQPVTGEPQLRVSALTEASQHLLVNTGIWDCLDAERLSPYWQMQVWDSDGTGEVSFRAEEVGASQLGWIVENANLVHACHRRLAGTQSVSWRADCKVAQVTQLADGWQVTLTGGEVLECDLLVGADGARSLVRAAANIGVGHRDTGHQALVTWLRAEQPHDDCARQWFLSSGPLAFLPLHGDGHQVSIVWSAVPARAEALAKLSPADLSQALTQASEGALGAVEVMHPAARFPIIEQHAASYVGERLVLIGDAAHVVHPLAGQGINLGLLDAAVLAEEILQARAKGLPIWQPDLLARYQRRRRGHNLVMQQSFRGLQQLFAAQAPALRWLRNTGMKLVNGATPLKLRLATEALGRHGDLPALARPQARQK